MHHTWLREGVTGYLMKKLFAPLFFNKTYSDEELEVTRQVLKKSLDDMERRLTQHKYITGEKVSIADLSASHELD